MNTAFPTVAANCGLAPPQTIPPGQDEFLLPLKLDPGLLPGVRPIVVARAWSSDVRAGRPGPCTQVILLNVTTK